MDYNGLAKSKMKGKDGVEAAGKIIGILFAARTFTHMAHLKTSSYAQHKALNRFYDDVIDLADSFAEVAQGKFGKLDIPAMPVEGNVDKPIPTLEMQKEEICSLGEMCSTGALKNIVDEIEALYLKTIYLLKELS